MIYKNTASQKVYFYAYTPADGLPKTGDAANITPYIAKDWGSVTAMADTSATEIDATNAKGFYVVDLAQAESNADILLTSAKSSTSGVVVVGAPAFISTMPTTGVLSPATLGRTVVVDASGLVDANVVKAGPTGSGVAVAAWTATRGLAGTALPAAAAGAAGGLPTSAAGALDLDALNTAAVRLSAARAQAIDDFIDGGRLDLILDAINGKTTNLPGAPAAVGSAMTLTSGERNSIAAALLDLADGVETGYTLRQGLRLMAAILCGKVSGGPGSPVFRSLTDAADRVSATADASGNRSAVTHNA